ncbi:MAG: DUF1549 and DUF1553 domain-containing protein, partial [Gemmataceae bacterium]
MPRLSALLTLLALGLGRVPAAEPRSYHFENDIEPILSRYNCNSSGCHGKAEGQNGFKLSVFGYDPAADHAALVKEGRGRRVFPAAPEQSLLLLKASGRVAHGGGVRTPVGSEDYETLRGWIAAGAPVGDPKAPHVVAIRIEPAERVMPMHAGQQLQVMARFSDGREIDATRHAKFQGNNDGLALVNAAGYVTTLDAPGDVAVMASYLGQVAVFRVMVPIPKPLAASQARPRSNFIDQHVDRKLAKLNIAASGVCDDAEFLRRAYLDVIGTLPTPGEARRFLAKPNRAKLVDELLGRPEFADYWALKWADLLRVDRQVLGHEKAYAFYKWIRDSLAANKPLDQFAREIITADGPLSEVGPAPFFKVAARPGEAASSLSQIFLGVRIACAECHHHPFDRWTQTDYFGMTAFFAPLHLQGELLLAADDDGVTVNPRTGEKVPAHVLGSSATATTPGDRRGALAEWMTSPANPYFARNLANRVWAHFLGRGLVEPVDDVRATNPPTNPELLDALAQHLVECHFDMRQLIRAITASRVYQTSSRPNATNERDEQNYSRALLKRLDAEVLLDMVCQTTGVPEKFRGQPEGSRAIQLWDSKVPHYFLRLFGRPERTSACACERTHEPGVPQVLHLLNSPEVHAKLGHATGTVARLMRQTADDRGLVEELYLTFASR